MSNPSGSDSGTTSKNAGVKTLAIRLEPDLHAELTLIAQLREQTVTDEIREAIETHIVRIKSNPEWAVKADDVLADIERQATARRDAFARLFGTTEQTDTASNPPAAAPPKESRSKRAGTSES